MEWSGLLGLHTSCDLYETVSSPERSILQHSLNAREVMRRIGGESEQMRLGKVGVVGGVVSGKHSGQSARRLRASSPNHMIAEEGAAHSHRELPVPMTCR